MPCTDDIKVVFEMRLKADKQSQTEARSRNCSFFTLPNNCLKKQALLDGLTFLAIRLYDTVIFICVIISSDVTTYLRRELKTNAICY